MTDIYNLQRFITAQEHVYDTVIRELNNGRKQTHWMWFIFPQINGLGKSPTATKFAIKSLAEAKAYLEHPILGQRLINCTQCVQNLEEVSAERIFGYPDYLKFQSCMTLFSLVGELVGETENIFKAALMKYYNGQSDFKTLDLLT